jgi:hypothetical protein
MRAVKASFNIQGSATGCGVLTDDILFCFTWQFPYSAQQWYLFLGGLWPAENLIICELSISSDMHNSAIAVRKDPREVLA